jgi:aryl carrier-like protein
VAAVLGLDAPDGFADDDNFVELGLSSFTALELSTRIRTAGLDLPPAVAFDHPTPRGVADYLLASLSNPGDQAEPAADPSPTRSVSVPTTPPS